MDACNTLLAEDQKCIQATPGLEVAVRAPVGHVPRLCSRVALRGDKLVGLLCVSMYAQRLAALFASTPSAARRAAVSRGATAGPPRGPLRGRKIISLDIPLAAETDNHTFFWKTVAAYGGKPWGRGG